MVSFTFCGEVTGSSVSMMQDFVVLSNVILRKVGFLELLLVSKESLEILWSFCTVDFGVVNLVYNCCFRNIYRYFVGDLLFLCVKSAMQSAMQFKREQQSCHVIFRCIPLFGFFGRPMRFRRVQQS